MHECVEEHECHSRVLNHHQALMRHCASVNVHVCQCVGVHVWRFEIVSMYHCA